MNYAKQVREYCEQHNNSLIDISIVRDSVFQDIPYKTLLKIFNRLEEEGMVHTISKGMYVVGNKSDNNKDMHYTGSGRGMIVVYGLFNSIGLTVYKGDKVEIYTNAITSKQKTIGSFLLKRVDLEFTDEIIELVSLLEILNVGFSMQGADFLSYKRTTELLVQTYSDDNFRKVIKAIRYMYSTVLKLSELLERLNIKNSCLKIYQC